MQRAWDKLTEKKNRHHAVRGWIKSRRPPTLTPRASIVNETVGPFLVVKFSHNANEAGRIVVSTNIQRCSLQIAALNLGSLAFFSCFRAFVHQDGLRPLF